MATKKDTHAVKPGKSRPPVRRQRIRPRLVGQAYLEAQKAKKTTKDK
ncbi:MAG: hypothetical protein ACFB0C_10695 [Leptolyngbyaceae cyanobacterium]